MSPSLSLEYNSQSAALSGWLGAGVVGVGWSLGGLPAVGRCPRTVAQDGVTGAVNYDGNDRFCLDGQRLIATNGTYGADGTEYRTEIESFSRVISHGAAGTGPAWFEVHSKSGQVLQFGNTTDSLILAQGKTTARSWGVNKVSDTKGNYFTVTYVNDTTNGQAYPSRIDYTANDAASLVAYNSVRFVYDTVRPDVTPIYHAGSLMKTSVRLTNVQAYSGSTLTADYRLAFLQSSATGRSQLASVTLCEGGGNCLPATSFTWQNGTLTPTVVSNVAGQNGTIAGSRAYLGDFNGDGLPDIMWDAEYLGPAVSTGTRGLWTNSGGGNFAVSSNFAGQNGTLSPALPVIGDFNRDGRADVWWFGATQQGGVFGAATKWTSLSSGGYAISAGSSVAQQGSLPAGVADINADSRADLFWYLPTPTPALTLWSTNADGSVSSNTLTPPSGAAPSGGGPQSIYQGTYSYGRGADFNGDGRADLLWTTASTGVAAIWLGNGDGTFGQISGVDTSVGGYNPTFADFNGDGKTDILWDQADSYGRSTGQRILWIGKGDGTFVVNANAGGLNGTLAGYVANLGDFNGDGLTDVLWVQADTNALSTGARVAWLSKGDGTFTVVSNYGGLDGTLVGYSPILADFNGDGKTDVLWDSRSGADTRSTGTRVLWLSDGLPPDIIGAVTGGTGATTVITYKSLTDNSVYTKDNTAVDPILDVQLPLRGVARVDVSNGIGGTLATSYAYVGAKMDLNGRGFLGFRQMTLTDLQTNIVLTTTYRQDYPYLNLVASETQVLGSNTLSSTSITYGAAALGGSRYQTFEAQSQITKNDLDGTSLPSLTTSYQFDAYNNATQVVVTTSDGYGKTVNNTYTNDTTNWLLGRLTASTATAQAPQQLGQYCSVPWGGTISSGQSVTAYSGVIAPVGQACSAIAQTRTCNNGTLSGSYIQQSCTPAACTLPWGGTIASGQSATAYSAVNPPVGQACTTIAQTRTCTNGVLGGSYSQQSCSALCALPWGGSMAQGQGVTAYSAASVSIGQVCSSVAQTRTCDASGALSGSFTYQSCTQPTYVTISSNVNNLGLWSYLTANGFATSGVPGTWVVTIASGVVVGASSTSAIALDTGVFPSGSVLQIINNGTITGAGGSGGAGGSCTYPNASAGAAGGTGGAALRAQAAVTIVNNGSIRGGGGGGGGAGVRAQFMQFSSGGGGGGGAGTAGGAGGGGGAAGSGSVGAAGAAGSLSAGGGGGGGGNTGGTAGGPGLAGSAGGTGTVSSLCSSSGGAGGGAGYAVLGNSVVTWNVVGDRRGPLN